MDEKGEVIKQGDKIEYTEKKRALLFINVFDNKGVKKHTFELLYYVLTTFNTTIDVNEEGGVFEEVIYLLWNGHLPTQMEHRWHSLLGLYKHPL